MTFPEGANQGEFERIKYSDLTYKTTGKKVLPDYQGPGFVIPIPTFPPFGFNNNG